MSADAHPFTPDGRYFVVRGRLWRRSNPSLPEEQRAALVSELMTATHAGRGRDAVDRAPRCLLPINHRSGRCALRLDGRSVLNEDGIACPRYQIIRPLRRQRIDRDAFADTRWTVTTAAVFTWACPS